MTESPETTKNADKLSDSHFVQDRFDEVPKRSPRDARTGVHREVARPPFWGRWFLWMTVSIIILTVIGIFALAQWGRGANDTNEPAGGQESSEVKARAELDPEATIGVINGTPTDGLGAAVSDEIVKEKWGDIEFVGSADSTDVKISAVFFSDPKFEPAAMALAEKLGGVSSYQNDSYASLGMNLVVVVGSDYQGPGKDNAAAFSNDQGTGDDNFDTSQ